MLQGLSVLYRGAAPGSALHVGDLAAGCIYLAALTLRGRLLALEQQDLDPGILLERLLRGDERGWAWLYGARQAATDAQRSRASRERLEGEWAEAQQEEHLFAEASAAQIARLRAVLSRLSPSDQVYAGWMLEGLSPKEIAPLARVSERSAQERCYQVRKAWRALVLSSD